MAETEQDDAEISQGDAKSTDRLKEALEDVVKSDANKRKILIVASEDDDPERKKPHLSPDDKDEGENESEIGASSAGVDDPVEQCSCRADNLSTSPSPMSSSSSAIPSSTTATTASSSSNLSSATTPSSSSSSTSNNSLMTSISSSSSTSCENCRHRLPPKTVIVGERGASIEYHGCRVNIPPGAVKKYTRIKLQFLDSKSVKTQKQDGGKTGRKKGLVVSPVLQCLPSGLQFEGENPVTIVLPLCVYPAKEVEDEVRLTALCQRGNGSVDQVNERKFGYEEMKIETNHFSVYYWETDVSQQEHLYKRLAAFLYGEGAAEQKENVMKVCICDDLPHVITALEKDLKSDGLRRLDSAHTLPVKLGDDVSIDVDLGPAKVYTIAPSEEVIKSESLWVYEAKIKSHFEVRRMVDTIERGNVTFNLKNNRSVNIRLVGAIDIDKKEPEDDSGTASSNSSPRDSSVEDEASPPKPKDDRKKKLSEVQKSIKDNLGEKGNGTKRKREEREEEIDDVLLYELSERIHEDRKKMALALKLNYVEEITPIEKKIPDDVVGQTFELFQRWKQRFGVDATSDKLLDALIRVKRQDCVDFLRDELQENQKKKQKSQ